MEYRIAVVQTRTYPDERETNVKYAVGYVEQAAALGARLVCLPETYPGPWTPPLDYDCLPALGEAARTNNVYVVAGFIEDAPDRPGKYLDTLALIGPDGNEVGRYRRIIPDGPWIYQGGSFWDFDYAAGNELPVFDIGDTTVGLLVCSEVYVPELSRLLAVKGAEILLMPAGMWKRAQWDNWRALLRARAIENLAYTATCQNIVGTEGAHAGLAMICSPEEVIAESAHVGVLVADCDLDRLRMLREAKDGPGFPGEKATKAGALWQWYRPDVFEQLTGN
jgi:predicted amidohydrolase